MQSFIFLSLSFALNTLMTLDKKKNQSGYDDDHDVVDDDDVLHATLTNSFDIFPNNKLAYLRKYLRNLFMFYVNNLTEEKEGQFQHKN